LGRTLAARGYLVLVPHYFDRTATRAEDLVDDEGVKPEGAQIMARHESAWLGTVRDAIDFAADLPGADRKRIGLVGFSLGAALAVSQAAHDPRIGAVVDYVGGLPFDEKSQIRTMPPVLILHGDDDKLVPLEWSQRLGNMLKDKGFPCEMHVYAGQGHYFSEADLRDAERRTLAFLDHHLNRM
jgi:carboxymethylenebutenolidase